MDKDNLTTFKNIPPYWIPCRIFAARIRFCSRFIWFNWPCSFD